MRSVNKFLLSVTVILGILLLVPLTANAQSISYKSLKYGTNQTSMATGYFVHPAAVVVRDNSYYVTMQIKTAKSLSPFPVKVLWVDGQTPRAIRKVRDRAGNSRLYYSFFTKNLKKRINAKLAIDVPKAYKARHLITFEFNPTGLPKLKAPRSVHHAVSTTHKAAVVSTASKPSTKSVSNSKTETPKEQQPSAVNDHAKTKSESHPSQVTHKKTPKKASSKKQTQQPNKTQSSRDTAKPKSNDPQKSHHKNNGTRWIVGGVVAVAAISAGAWIYLRH
ncbi:NEAT domain-containing protein [Lentilactobacillus kisonensis]|uniref:NEAT domain-containing protein n=1 Tax=Lentilactobacillus kisonensis TaxID=481722 RepID=UPI0006D046F8|nr:NEAT domain-containing protein [Lentilactobacillus kisonensis]